MPSAAEKCHEPSGNCEGISHRLESGHSEYKLTSNVNSKHILQPFLLDNLGEQAPEQLGILNFQVAPGGTTHFPTPC